MSDITDSRKFPTADYKLTLLMKAIINGATASEIQEILMQGGKDTINARSNVGRTAMNYAMRRGNHEVYNLLKEHGGMDLDENSKEEIPAICGAASADHSDLNLSEHLAILTLHNLKFDEFRSLPLENSTQSAPSVACAYLQDPKLKANYNSPAYLQGQGHIKNESVTDMMHLDKFCDHISDNKGQEDSSTSFIPTPDSPEISRMSGLPKQTRPTDQLLGVVHSENFAKIADAIKFSIESRGTMYDEFPGRSFIEQNTEHVSRPEKLLFERLMERKKQEQGSALSNDQDCNTKNSDNPTENPTTLENAKLSDGTASNWEALLEAVIIHQLGNFPHTEHVSRPEKPLFERIVEHKTQEQGSALSNDEDCNTKNSDNPTENLTTLENEKLSVGTASNWEALLEAVTIHQLGNFSHTEHVSRPEKPLFERLVEHKTQEQGSSLSSYEDCNTKNSENLTTLENAKLSVGTASNWEILLEAVKIHQLKK